MEELSSSRGLQCPKPNSPSQMNMQPFNNLSAPSMEVINPSVNYGMISTEGFYTHQSQHPIATTRNVPHLDSLLHFFPSNHGCNNTANMTNKAETMLNSSPSASGVALGIPTKNYGGKKRKRGNEREMEKPREVVHVRARRGQATDSHSLAERLRREKINEKMRCLQDLVPGCYKTMGMAVMLDVIINYVRSLQNQIDFLSMKLSAASLYYDFNSSEAEAIETLQGTTGYEAILGMDKVVGEGYNHGGISHFQTSWPPL